MNTSMNQQQPEAAQDNNHIDTVRQHLLDQLRALRSANSPETVRQELDRSKGVSELAQAIVNTAKVEVEYLRAVGHPDASSKFLGAAQLPAPAGAEGSQHNVHQLGAPGNGITSITRHTLKG